MKTGLKCVYGHVTRCFDQKRRDIIYNLLQGTEDVINLLCTPGRFRERKRFKNVFQKANLVLWWMLLCSNRLYVDKILNSNNNNGFIEILVNYIWI